MVNVFHELKKMLNNKYNNLDTSYMSANNDYVLLRRAILSPTHIEYCHPIPLLKSRFSNIANMDYALRLCIVDDSNCKLNNCKSKDKNFIKDLIRSILLDGIVVGERRYELLGSSSSQMRENGIIMYAKDNLKQTAQDIRNSAGDLRKFKRNVPKYVARLGLLFSQVLLNEFKSVENF